MLLSFGGTKDQAPLIRPMLPRLIEGLRQGMAVLNPEVYPWMFANFGPEVEAWQRDGCPAKTTTIRVAPHDAGGLPDWERSRYARLKPGDTLHVWWKSRTPARFKIGEVPFHSARRVEMVRAFHPPVNPRLIRVYDGEDKARLSEIELDTMARDDGFPDTETFWRYFCPDVGLAFDGFQIRWGKP